jgi:hypothetical protein
MFALLTTPGESKMDINPGQRIRIKKGTLRDTAFLQQNQIPETLDQESRRAVEGQPIFLTLEEGDVEILSRAASDGKAPAQ